MVSITKWKTKKNMSWTLIIIFALRFLGIGANKSKSNARLSLLGAAFGIGISIIPLVVVLVVSDGMVKGIAERTVELGTGQAQIIDMEPSSYFENCENEFYLKEKIKQKIKNPYFLNAWVQREGEAILVGKNGRRGGVVKAVESDFFTKNIKANSLIKIIEGKPKLENESSIILGEKIAEKLGLSVGDICRLITLKESAKDGKTKPKINTFKVEAIISSGYQELDGLWIFISLKKGITLLSKASSIDSILLSTKDPFDEFNFSSLLKEIENKILLLKEIPSTFSIYTWQDLNKALFYSFATTKNLILFIVFLITLVASINISHALIMLVMERRGEIAILKATGAPTIFITLSFLLSGFITSFLGLSIGIPLGILISVNINTILNFFEKIINWGYYYAFFIFGIVEEYSQIHLLDPAYYLENIPIELNINELYFISFITLLLSLLVSIIPAIKAGREKPIEIMRKI